MPKPDPTLLDPACYRFRCEIPPRFTDLDLNQHVNNVALVDLMQEARVRFHHASGYDRAVAGITAMAASFSIEYLGQACHPDLLEVHVAVIAVGRTSHTVGQLAMQNGRLVAFARTVIVCVQNDRPAENPSQFRESIKEWMLKS